MSFTVSYLRLGPQWSKGHQWDFWEVLWVMKTLPSLVDWVIARLIPGYSFRTLWNARRWKCWGECCLGDYIFFLSLLASLLGCCKVGDSSDLCPNTDILPWWRLTTMSLSDHGPSPQEMCIFTVVWSQWTWGYAQLDFRQQRRPRPFLNTCISAHQFLVFFFGGWLTFPLGLPHTSWRTRPSVGCLFPQQWPFVLHRGRLFPPLHKPAGPAESMPTYSC